MIPGVTTAAVADRLRRSAATSLRVLHRGEHALYLDLDGSAIGVLSKDAVVVPCGIATRLGGVGALAGQARIVSGQLWVGRQVVRIARLHSLRAPRIGTPAVGATDWWESVELASDVREFAAQVPHDITARTALQILGRGPGLTPLGDDILAGWLAVHAASGQPDTQVAALVNSARARTTMLSATLLDHAVAGEVVPEFADFLGALGTGRAVAAAARVARIGATSGAGLLLGAARAQRRLLIEREVA